MLLAFTLQLPAPPPTPAAAGQSVPAQAAPSTTAEPSWTLAWTEDVTDADDPRLAVSAEAVFVAGPDTPLRARALTSGATLWQHTQSSWQTLTAAESLVLGVSGDHAYTLDAGTGRTRWVTTTTGAATRLMVDGAHVLMASDSDLLLRELQTGTPLWRVGLTAPPSAPVVIDADTIVAATGDGFLTAMERHTGAPRWQRTLSNPATVLAVGGGAVYAGFANGTLCSYSARTGGEDWCFPLRIPLAGAPVVDGDRVRVALLDNSLRSFDRQSGSMQQPISLGHRPAAGPWLSPSSVIVALTTGEFVVIDRQTQRIDTRLPAPTGSGLQVLDRAGFGADGRSLATLTIAPSGERRLSVYRIVPAGTLPVLARPPVLPFPWVSLPVPGLSRETRPAVPRPFPSPR